MTVNRALKRLRVLLIASGFDENEAADYLREMSARDAGGVWSRLPENDK